MLPKSEKDKQKMKLLILLILSKDKKNQYIYITYVFNIYEYIKYLYIYINKKIYLYLKAFRDFELGNENSIDKVDELKGKISDLEDTLMTIEIELVRNIEVIYIKKVKY